jgi:hypothetical protein
MAEKEMDNKNELKLKSAQINRALGLFTLFFGIVIIIAILFTETTIGQITNLVAGSILVAIGGGMAWKSKTVKK